MSEKPEQAVTIEAVAKRLAAPLRRYFERRIARDYAHEVDDLVQEVFARLAAAAKVRTLKGVEPYLFQIAANLLSDHHRKVTSRQLNDVEPFDAELHADAVQTVSLEREVIGREALEALIAALGGLPERTRTVWVLYHFEDLPHAQIGRQLGMAQSTIEKHMTRANAHLAKAYKRHE